MALPPVSIYFLLSKFFSHRVVYLELVNIECVFLTRVISLLLSTFWASQRANASNNFGETEVEVV